MALLEVLSAPINLQTPPDVTGDVQSPTSSSFEVVNGPQTIEISGFGFAYDAVTGDPIAGTVTGIDWLPASPTSFDFTLSGINWQLDGPQGDVSDTGFFVDGMTLFGSMAEWAAWLNGDDVLQGSEFSDTLSGFAGNDTLFGNGGDDLLEGWSGNDELHGGEGSDNLLGGAGDDTLDGGAGNFDWAQYWDATGAVTVDLAAGTATGPTGNDVLIEIENAGGSGFDDVLLGNAGDNQFTGGQGNDFIDGGAGFDWANYWDAAGDVIIDLNGGRAFGAAGNDTLVGIEHATGSNHNDTIFGSMGGTGTNQPSNLRGEFGNDSIVGGFGNEFITGGAGDDFIEGGQGVDTADYQFTGATGGVNVDLTTGVVTGGEGNDTLSGIENVTGTNFDDVIIGNAANNFLQGFAGDDSLQGGAGSDFFMGGAGNDTIDGGVVTDHVNYTDLNTVSYEDDGSGVTIDLSGITGDGSAGSGTATSASGTDVLRNVNFVRGGGGNDSITGSTALIFEQFEGGAGNDTIDGGEITDTVTGQNSNRVSYQGAGGAVTVDLEAETAQDGLGGTDTLVNINQVRGSNFGDTLLGSDRTDVRESFEGRAGNDSIDGRGGLDMVRYDAASNGVNVNLATGLATGADGNDTLTGIEQVRGSQFNDALTGDDGNNQLEGMGGNDNLVGGAGNDTLLGGAGGDTLVGGAGDDVLDGGAIVDRTNFNDLNTVNYGSDTSGVVVNLSGITGDGNSGSGVATGTEIGNDQLKSINRVFTGSGNDSILGSSAALIELFDGGRGNDTIDGGALLDPLQLGTNRVVYSSMGGGVKVDLGTGGNGTAVGSVSGSDVLRNIHAVYGTTGNDTIIGSNDNTYTEQFSGLKGNDSIDGRGGFDILRADASNGNLNVNLATGRMTSSDTLEGVDTLAGIEGVFGGNGNDVLTGGNTANGANFADGKLEVFRGGGGNDTIDGGVGMDRADYSSSTTGVHVDLGAGRAFNDGVWINNVHGQDTLTGIEGIRGSDSDDTLVGSDRATADGYFEFFEGRAGNDSIDGKGGIDRVDYQFAGGSVNVNLTDGRAWWDGYGGTDTLVGIENVRGSNWNDTLRGSAANNVLEGGAGQDLLQGGAGNDTLDGGVVTDKINYTDGNFVSYSWDTLGVNIDLSGITGDGSQGSGVATARSTLEGNVGTDVLRNINFVVGGQGDDSIKGSSALIFEMFDGAAGNDTIDGGAITDPSNANRINYYVNGLGEGNHASVIVDLGAGTATGADIGNDQLININQVRGSITNDTIFGSDRTDLAESFEGRDGNDSIDGRGGIDNIRYDLEGLSAGVNVNLGTGIAVAVNGTDTLAGIEGVFGTRHGDVLTGGGTSHDYSDAGVFEVFRGLGGNDTIDGADGFDRVDYSTSPGGVVVDLGAGTAQDGFGGTDDLSNIEGVIGSNNNDSMYGSDRNTYDEDGYLETFQGNRGSDYIDGRGGVDVVIYAGSTAGVNVNLATGIANDGMNGNDTLVGIEAVVGSDFNDVLTGDAGNNRLDGRKGADTMAGGAGDDRYIVDSATDVVSETIAGSAGGWDVVELNYNPGTYTLGANIEEAALMAGGAGNLTGNALDNWLDGNDAANQLSGGLGNDTLVSNGGNDVIDGGAGTDVAWIDGNFDDFTVTRPDAATTILTAGSNVITLRGVETIQFLDGIKTLEEVQAGSSTAFDDLLEGDDEDNALDGLGGNDTLSGKGGNDTLNGGAGADSMTGGAGNDTFIVDNLGDKLVELADEGIDEANVGLTAAGTYVLADNVENATITTALAGVNVTGNALDNVLVGGAGANVLNGGAGNDTLDGGAGNDTLAGGVGNDTYVVNVATDVVSEAAGAGDDEVRVNFTAAGTYVMTANVENATVVTASSTVAVNVTGNASNNLIVGHAGNNALSGGLGDDTLEGSGGKDTLDGGAGNDVARIDGNFDDFTVARPDALTTILTAGANVITLRGVESIQFLDGIKTLEEVQAGWPTAFADVLEGDEGDDTFDGLAGNDTILGAGGNDTINGGAGADSMIGGTGDDTFVVDNLGDKLVELADEGADEAKVGLTVAGTYVLADNVENATITTALAGVNVTGNALDNVLVGGAGANVLSGAAGNDTLDGGAGSDTLMGGVGNDTYVVNVATDVVSEAASAGDDEVRVNFAAAGTYAMTLNVENASVVTASGTVAVNVTGNASNNLIVGHAGNNVLLGGLGDDTLQGSGGKDTLDGGAGNDVARVDGNFDEFTVTRPDALTTVLTAGANVITLRGVETVEFLDGVKTLAEVQAGWPTPFADLLEGEDGADDTLDGLAGNDTLNGKGGNDSLAGGLGDDRLDGGTGDDTLVGGAGNDTYVVDSEGDVVVEVAAAGTDTIRTTLDAFTLATLANVEHLAYEGAGNFNGSGNNAANGITGGAGDDTLDGGLGNDTLAGGLGDDTYVINAATDVVVEAAEAGDDTVRVAYTVAGTYTLGANIENATATGTVATNLTGNALGNRLEGNALNNVIAGGAGGDTLIVTEGSDTLDGGADSDTVHFSGDRADWSAVSRLNATDLQVRNGASIVTMRNIESFVFGDAVLSLEEFLENSLSPFADIWNGTEGNDESGDALAGVDVLDGKGGNDTLNGGLGADSMIGGTGDDTFIVDNLGDKLVENADEGTDEARVGLTVAGTYVLADNVENATITTALAGVNVTGNALDNVLVGGAGANVLNGGAGNDTLDGGLGSDALAGGLGNDIYVVNVATDVVSEAVSAGDDEVRVNFAAAGTYVMTANVETAIVTTASSTVAVNVTGNASDNDIIGHAGNNVLLGGLGNDILEGNGGVDSLDGGAGTDEAILKGTLQDYTVTRISATQTRFVHSDGSATVTMSGIENLLFYGDGWADESDDTSYVLQNLLSQLSSPGNDTITGTSGDDTIAGLDGLAGLNGGAGNDLINGGTGDDRLIGGAGNDTLVGGADNDTLEGGTGADTYRFGAGGGNDVIRENDATALVVDTLVIDAESGNLAGGEVRLTRSSSDATDLVLTITSGDDADVVDQLVVDGFFTAADGINAAGAIEQIRFTDGNVTLTQAQILSELLKGTGGGDWIRGYAGNDAINGLEGNDTINGAAGNDTLIGNLGDDQVFGGLGNDLLQGNLGADTLDGGDGNDVLDGGAGHDSLVGGTGADALLGGAGNDVLEGGDGLDTLTGGSGNDVLAGGDGADRFVLNSLSGIDEITDFVAGIDKIAINKSVFTAVTGAVSATPTTLAGLGGAFDYDGGSGELTYDADGAGGADAIVVANIGTGLTLANDFLIIG